ncbi:MAG: RNA chaperone Hfq [Deferribacterota bacterium]|nr:RNA chaperone Hfq [Deferribacterota bacterium]
MSLTANIEFIYLHNARLRYLELEFLLNKGVVYKSQIVDFDQYTINIKVEDFTYNIVKRDLQCVRPVKNVLVVDIDYISKTYYLAGVNSRVRHRRPPIQDIFLNEVRKYGLSVELLMKDLKVYRGKILGFDNFTILLNIDDIQHMFYKNNILEVYPLEQKFEIIKYVEEKSNG